MPACVPCGACPPFRAGSQAVPGLCGVSRQLDGVAELLWISKRNNIRLDAMKRLSGPSIIGHAFTVCIRTENQNQMSFYPFVLHEISVLVELILGHLRYLLTDVPPQPNSPPDNVFHLDRHRSTLKLERGAGPRFQVME